MRDSGNNAGIEESEINESCEETKNAKGKIYPWYNMIIDIAQLLISALTLYKTFLSLKDKLKDKYGMSN